MEGSRSARFALLAAAALAAGAAALALARRGPAGGTMTVVYRGERFDVPRVGTEYSEEQAARIEKIILGETPPASFPSFDGLVRYQRGFAVPGQGESTGGFGDETPLGRFTFLAVEIPRRGRHRVLVYRQEGPAGAYRFFDDFICEGPHPPVLTFRAQGGELLYVEDLTKRVLRTRTPARPRSP